MSAPAPGSLHSVNPDLLARIPLTARHVLQLGGGDGALAARYKTSNPRVRWSVIDPDHNATGTVSGTVDDLLTGDVEALGDAELDRFVADAPPDVLVFGDVLENLREPLPALQRLVQRLAPGGCVVACISNVGHWSVVAGLLQGQWNYADAGLLDRTHLRFFTLESGRKLLADAGLSVIKLYGREIPLNAAGQVAFLDSIRPALQGVPGGAAAAEARLKTLQYVLVAQKPPVEPIIALHQLVLVRDLMEARIGPPWTALSTLPAVIATVSDKQFSRPRAPNVDSKVAVIQRQLVGDLEGWRDFSRKLIADGWVTVAEWDDHPDLLPEPAHSNFLRHPWMTMSGVHACQVSTPRLGDAFSAHNPEVAVFANALPEIPPLPEKDPSVIRIVYAAMSRPGVARLISIALDAAALDPRVEIVVAGDDKVFASTRATRKRFLKLLPYREYLDLLASADIVLMPLKGEPAELYKSPLKFMEAASRGALCIASPHIYEETIEHGRTGWIARAPHEWTTLLLRAIADADERLTMARAAWETVRDRHLLAYGLQAKIDWYRSLVARRAELTEALLARHPELRP